MQSLWMVLASLLFASMGVCVKLGSAQFSAAELAFYRGGIATLMMAALMLARGWRFGTPHWKVHLVRGVSGSISLVLYFGAISHLPLPTAVTLNYTSPLFMAWWLAIMRGERLSAMLTGALGIGFVGVITLLQPTLQANQWLGAVMGLGSGLLASAAYLSVRRLGALGEPEWRTVFWFSLVSTGFGALWVAADEGFHPVDLRGGLLLGGVGGLGMLAQLAMTAAYKRGRTLVSASLAYTTVGFSTCYAMLLWQQMPAPLAWLGMLLIVASGVMAITDSARRR